MINKKYMFRNNVILVFEFVFLINIINGNDFFCTNKLKFNSNGKFKIVQFTDLHQTDCINLKTVHFMGRVLDYEKPDFVVLTGDNIDGRYCMSMTYENAIASIAKPMENRKIPWAVVLGNHDTETINVERKAMIKKYMKYKYNMNKIVDGGCAFNLIVNDSKNKSPVFNMYMMDSGSYDSKGGYGCIKPSEVEWYRKTSKEIRNKYGHLVPAVMFFHIPLVQYYKAWNKEKIDGEKNESICPQSNDNGLFKAIINAGDVKAIFVGHDHTNDCVGKSSGIIMGYGRCSGYDAYIKSGYKRGARVFYIDENNISKIKSWERLEKN